MLLEFAAVQDGLLGDEEYIMPEWPVMVDGEFVGGTALERSGIQGIKDTQCYTNTLSHQHLRDIVRITASAKIFNGELSEMQKIRICMAAVSFIYCLRSIDFEISAAGNHCDYGIHGGLCPKRLPSTS